MCRTSSARRHLNEAQRAMVAARLANMTREDTLAQNRSANLQNGRVSQDEAAKKLNVSTRSVATAKRVQEKAAPSVIKAARDGKLSLNAAAKAANVSERSTRKVLDKGTPELVAPANLLQIYERFGSTTLQSEPYRVCNPTFCALKSEKMQ